MGGHGSLVITTRTTVIQAVIVVSANIVKNKRSEIVEGENVKLLTKVKNISAEELSSYTPVYSLPSYTIFQHPKTFEHIAVRIGRKKTRDGNIYIYTDCGRWLAHGGISDPPVTLPAGFLAEMIEEFRARPSRAAQITDRPVTLPRELPPPSRWTLTGSIRTDRPVDEFNTTQILTELREEQELADRPMIELEPFYEREDD